MYYEIHITHAPGITWRVRLTVVKNITKAPSHGRVLLHRWFDCIRKYDLSKKQWPSVAAPMTWLYSKILPEHQAVAKCCYTDDLTVFENMTWAPSSGQVMLHRWFDCIRKYDLSNQPAECYSKTYKFQRKNISLTQRCCICLVLFIFLLGTICVSFAQTRVKVQCEICTCLNHAGDARSHGNVFFHTFHTIIGGLDRVFELLTGQSGIAKWYEKLSGQWAGSLIFG